MKAFKTFNDCPIELRNSQVDLDYPWQVQECTADKAVELQNLGYTVLSDEDYTLYLSQTKFNSIDTLKRVPKVVTPRQIRTALVLSGFLISSIESAINSLPEPQKSITFIAWDYSTEFQRDNPLIMSMAPMLGLNESQIDDLFIYAAGLQ